MFKKYAIFIAVIFFLLHSLESLAQVESSPWTLEKCINYALENNLSVKVQKLSLENQEIALKQAQFSMLPSLNGSVTHNYNWGKSVDRYTNQFTTDRIQSNNFYLGTQVSLFSGFQLMNTWRQKIVELKASELDLEKFNNDISLSIATAYLQILYNLESVQNAKAQLEITKMQLEKSKKMLEAGAISRGTYLSVEAQQASEEMNLITYDNNLKLSLLTLAQMLDLKDAAQFMVAVPEVIASDSLIIVSQTPEEIFNYALKNQPEIEAAEYRVKSSEYGLKIARGGRYPSLSLSGSYGTGYSEAGQEISGVTMNGYDTIGITSGSPSEYVLGPQYSYDYSKKSFSDQIKDNASKSVGLTLSIPIFNSWSVNSNIQRSKIALESARLNRQMAEQNLLKTIEQAYADAQGAVLRFRAAKKQYLAYQESFQYNQEKFNIGLITVIDYNDSKTKTNTAKSDLLQAKYEFLFRLKILEFYLGKDIKL